MANLTVIRYTVEELHHLRESPLCVKPAGLPEITKWMESSVDVRAQHKPRTASHRESSETAENGGRPTLVGTRHFSRNSTTSPEDIILGPPKAAFGSASSIRTLKNNDSSEKRTLTTYDDDSTSNIRDRFFRSRENERDSDRRDKSGMLNGRRRPQDEGETWANLRSRKSFGQEDSERPHRNGDRDRRQRDDEGDETPQRRSTGRGRFEQLWSRGEDSGVSLREPEGVRLTPKTQGGWRDREQQKRETRDERGWGRQQAQEEDPEWMDTPVKPEKKTVRTQEDFQRWKERMKAGATPAEEKEPEQAVPPPPKTTTPSALGSGPTSKPATPLAVEEGAVKNMFTLWGGSKLADPDTSTLSKSTPAKPKSSRFASLFSAPEPQEKPPSQPPMPAPAPVEAEAGPGAGASEEDKEGFARVLQMLNKSSIEASPSPQHLQGQFASPSVEKPNPLAGLFGPPPMQSPEERFQSPPGTIRLREEQRTVLLETVLSQRPPSVEKKGMGFPPMSPTFDAGMDRFRSPVQSDRDAFSPLQGPPRTGSQPSDSLAALIGGRPQEHQQGLSRDREFLLNLMQGSSRGGTPQSQQQQNGPRAPAGPPNERNMQMFFDQKAQQQQQPQQPQQMSKPRVPPGFFDERAFLEAELQAHAQAEAMRKPRNMSQAQQGRGPPPGLYDDPSIAAISRRSISDAPSGGPPLRQPTNMGIPQQPVPGPDSMWIKPMGVNDRGSIIPPPPGFGGNAASSNGPQSAGPRQGPPPGFQFGGPGSAGNTPLGPPGMNVGGPRMPPPPGMMGPVMGPAGPAGYPFAGPPPGFPPMDLMMGPGGPVPPHAQGQRRSAGPNGMAGPGGPGGPPPPSMGQMPPPPPPGMEAFYGGRY